MNVLVFGCGYLGKRVARLWQGLGHNLFVVTRSNEHARRFKQDGFQPIVADVTVPELLGELPAAEIVLYCIGYDRAKYDDIRDVYVTGFSNVLKNLNHAVEHLVYISTTGVYGNCNGAWVDELTDTAPARTGAKACLEAESLIATGRFATVSTILRLAGIYGENRIPKLTAIKQRDFRSLSPTGHINLIHVDDAAQIVVDVVDRKLKDEVFLVSDGTPPIRRDFYQFVADRLQLGTIQWRSEPDVDVATRASIDKRISNRKLLAHTGYQFKYPDYRAGIRSALGAESS